MKHKIEIAPNLAIYIDGERVIGSKPHGLFLITEMIVSDEDLKRLSDRCLEVIADTPQTETQTETQNSNLTFEKRTMRDCYNCKKFETEDECIECHYEPKDEPKLEGIWNAGYKTGYDKGYKDAQKVKDSQGLVNDLVKAFCEDGTWLERQGVYTLTLAEAKQRAVDIIESIIERKEGE